MKTEEVATGAWVRIRHLLNGALTGEDRGVSVLMLSDCCNDVGKLALKVALEEAAEGRRVLVADLWPEFGFDAVASWCMAHCNDDVKRLLRRIVYTSFKSAFEGIMTESVCRDVAHAASDGPMFDVVVTTSMNMGDARNMFAGVPRPRDCTLVAVVDDHLRVGRKLGSVAYRVDAVVTAEREGSAVTMSIIKNRFGPHETFSVSDDADGICLVDKG